MAGTEHKVDFLHSMAMHRMCVIVWHLCYGLCGKSPRFRLVQNLDFTPFRVQSFIRATVQHAIQMACHSVKAYLVKQQQNLTRYAFRVRNHCCL